MSWDRYVTPFSYGLWLAVTIAACAISVCLALTNQSHEKKHNLTVSAILFYIDACFCQQRESYKF
jgi:NADH:ubiquinone oxidoreductase subunit K